VDEEEISDALNQVPLGPTAIYFQGPETCHAAQKETSAFEMRFT
jgi:hypothetical protein